MPLQGGAGAGNGVALGEGARGQKPRVEGRLPRGRGQTQGARVEVFRLQHRGVVQHGDDEGGLGR